MLFVCIHGGISTVGTAMNTGEDFSTCDFFRLVIFFRRAAKRIAATVGMAWTRPFGVPGALVLNVLAVIVGTLFYTVVKIVVFLEGTFTLSPKYNRSSTFVPGTYVTQYSFKVTKGVNWGVNSKMQPSSLHKSLHKCTSLYNHFFRTVYFLRIFVCGKKRINDT